ncbi:hypothetical protein QBC37DRAFT_370658 [Rhypophila decipiens]|uniref:Uncharacterized protein n=1 Tax=Rhypophila decipiens TaxID=261697 RepID=A0AAN6YFM8_9PEZI|nr:hypothetical protein QBC37DRAFT_370658 [Rhypophila decipiens]
MNKPNKDSLTRKTCTPRLFRPTKDLESILTTLNYFLYLLPYLEAKDHNLKSQAITFITKHSTSPDATLEDFNPADSESCPFARLDAVVYHARATLRLFGLLPL